VGERGEKEEASLGELVNPSQLQFGLVPVLARGPITCQLILPSARTDLPP
jgi:hypothetical protein